MAVDKNIKPRMTLEDVCQDMRSRGQPMDKGNLRRGIQRGLYPFAVVQNVGPSGRATYLIWRRDYEKWAEEYLH